MATRFHLEVDLDSPRIASVEDLSRLLRAAADQLSSVCGNDCEFSARCPRCWSDLRLTAPDGAVLGTGRIVVEG